MDIGVSPDDARHVLVTGANRGIGLGLTREYLARGAHVFAGARAPATADELDTLRSEFGDSLTVVSLDVVDLTAIEAAAQLVEETAGGLDVLINNAGVYHRSDGLADVDTDAMIESFRVNALGPLVVTRAFLPLLSARSELATVVNVTMPTRPIGDLSRREDHAYVVSRYATNAITKMTANEVAGSSVIAVGLYPGFLATYMSGHNPRAAPVGLAMPNLVSLIEALELTDNGMCVMPDGSRSDW